MGIQGELQGNRAQHGRDVLRLRALRVRTASQDLCELTHRSGKLEPGWSGLETRQHVAPPHTLVDLFDCPCVDSPVADTYGCKCVGLGMPGLDVRRWVNRLRKLHLVERRDGLSGADFTGIDSIIAEVFLLELSVLVPKLAIPDDLLGIKFHLDLHILGDDLHDS